MDDVDAEIRLDDEIIRLATNAAGKREGLLRLGLRKSKTKRSITVVAGLLALVSAGSISAIAAEFVSSKGLEIMSALVAALSGICSLVVSVYYKDEDIMNMMSGSSKYLALRESVYRLVIHPGINAAEKFGRLEKLQDQYANLDQEYAKYFTTAASSIGPTPIFEYPRISKSAERAMYAESDLVKQELVKFRKD